MFAIVQTGGKQYRVEKDSVLRVERLAGEEGAEITLGSVMAVGEGQKIKLGTPWVEGAQVKVRVLEQTRNDTITVFKKKRRKGYRRTRGHRQPVSVLRVTSIKG